MSVMSCGPGFPWHDLPDTSSPASPSYWRDGFRTGLPLAGSLHSPRAPPSGVHCNWTPQSASPNHPECIAFTKCGNVTSLQSKKEASQHRLKNSKLHSISFRDSRCKSSKAFHVCLLKIAFCRASSMSVPIPGQWGKTKSIDSKPSFFADSWTPTQRFEQKTNMWKKERLGSMIFLWQPGPYQDCHPCPTAIFYTQGLWEIIVQNSLQHIAISMSPWQNQWSSYNHSSKATPSCFQKIGVIKHGNYTALHYQQHKRQKCFSNLGNQSVTDLESSGT